MSNFRRLTSFLTMETIPKDELNQIVRHGIAADIFIAQRASSLFRAISNESNTINETRNCSQFFGAAQAAFKDQIPLSLSPA